MNEKGYRRAVRTARTRAAKWAAKGDFKRAHWVLDTGMANAEKKWGSL